MRPQFHFTAESGWINDPHGITVKDGSYHLFYQYVPDSMVWEPNCHWGHAAGPDLFALEPRPVALAPGEGDDGIWTGSLVTDEDGVPRIFYTSTIRQNFGVGRIRVAMPDDSDWNCWSKQEGLLAEAPADLDVIAYRDPFVFRDGTGWRMYVGAGLRDGTATALTYVSPDLETWTYDGIAAQRSTNEREPVWTGSLWECPQLFEIDGRHVLVTSVWDDDVLYYAGYGIGTYEDGRFIADTWGQLSFGRCYYAPSFFRDAAGRPCLSFWMRGVRDDQVGWSSAHSVPHLLSLDSDRLVATPHPDLDKYAGQPLDEAEPIPGNAVDIRWQPTGPDRTVINYGDRQVLRIETDESSLVAFGASDPSAMPYTGGVIRVILDGPTAEISTCDGVLGTPISATNLPLKVARAGVHPEVRPLRR